MVSKNGKIVLPRCSVSECYSPTEWLVKSMCERHFRERIIEPLEKRRNAARIEAERLAGEISRANHDVKQAKVDAGVIDALPFMHCHNADCTFKSQYWNTIEAHEALCNKKSSPTTPKKPRAPHAQATFIDDEDEMDSDLSEF